MIKRLEWLIDVPEAMNTAQMEINLVRISVKLADIPRNRLEDKIKTVRNWIEWYNKTDFPGRFRTNQVVFVERLLPILVQRLALMGNKRAYFKSKNYVNGKRKRQTGTNRNLVGRTKF